MQFPWNRMETELKRELAHHLHELTAEYERRGHSHEEAMRMAKREFGGSEQVKEQCRDERRWAWMTGIRQDVVFALRQMRRSPGFAVTADPYPGAGHCRERHRLRRAAGDGAAVRGCASRGDRVMTLGLTKLTYPLLA